MNHGESAYGLWSLVFINSAIFIMFAFSFFKPATARDWRSFGAFSAFIVALFVEMYGFPLTIYLLSGWLQARFPNLDLLSHESGHLWSTLLGDQGNPHFSVLHIASYLFLGFGFYLLSAAWNVLYHAQRRHSLATVGPYGWIRHPVCSDETLSCRGFSCRQARWHPCWRSDNSDSWMTLRCPVRFRPRLCENASKYVE